MSASSNCVTCGIITQLRASPGAEIFWMRVRACSLDRSELGEVHLGPRRQTQIGEPAAARAGAAGGQRRFTKD